MSQSKQKIKISSFISKLQLILEDKNNSNIVSWGPLGDAFIVFDSQQFEEIVLPKYFKHKNYSSFLRQMNMYNFQKIRNYNNQSVFWHRNFQRGKEHLMATLQRNHKKQQSKPESDKSNILHKELSELNRSLENDQQRLLRILTQNEMKMQQHKQIFYVLQEQSQGMELQLDRLTMYVQTVLNMWNKLSLKSSSKSESDFLEIDSSKLDERKDFCTSEVI